jgi:hypothetical protein
MVSDILEHSVYGRAVLGGPAPVYGLVAEGDSAFVCAKQTTYPVRDLPGGARDRGYHLLQQDLKGFWKNEHVSWPHEAQEHSAFAAGTPDEGGGLAPSMLLGTCISACISARCCLA